MKETRFLKLDRNSASPTESADGGKETGGNTPELTVRTVRWVGICTILGPGRAVRAAYVTCEREADKGVCNAGGTAGRDYPSRNIII